MLIQACTIFFLFSQWTTNYIMTLIWQACWAPTVCLVDYGLTWTPAYIIHLTDMKMNSCEVWEIVTFLSILQPVKNFSNLFLKSALCSVFLYSGENYDFNKPQLYNNPVASFYQEPLMPLDYSRYYGDRKKRAAWIKHPRALRLVSIWFN